MVTHDPFGTGALRRAVLDAWLASPTRFREDANAEEDHARGYYRDRVVVELAQNAADAAARAGVPGRLELRLEAADGGWRLVAGNTGAPLDAEGVASLASLRASAKSGAAPGVVGRFGVGFAAVRSVSDEVVVRSRTGGVRFSLQQVREDLGRSLPTGPEIGRLPRDRSVDGPISSQPTEAGGGGEHLAREAGRRGDSLPVLRLPYPVDGVADGGVDTSVELALRDASATAAVSAQLAALDDALLLALPALDEVLIHDDFAGQQGSGPVARVLRDAASRWRVHRASGTLPADDTLPTEERRPDWSVLWALPTETPTGQPAGTAAAVLHAPTPTDVRLSFPALLVASFPVDPGRRGVLPGATADRVAAEAGRAYADFLGELAAERDVLGLVPTGLPASDVDAAVRAAADAALRATALLPLPADDLSGALRTAPEDATYLPGPLGEDAALARALAAGSPAVSVTVPVRYQALVRSLGGRPADLAELVEALPPDPGTVRAALDALAEHAGDRLVLEAVAGVPLPLADGRVARGARGTVLLDAPHLAGITRALGVRVVHPDVAHPLLERVGATPTSPERLLADAAVRTAALAAAEEVLDDGDPGGLARVLSAGVGLDPADDVAPTPEETVRAVLELARLAVGEGEGRTVSADDPRGLPFWLGELPVVADDDVVPLREAALPGTWAAGNLDLALVRGDVVGRWGREVLAAAGARADLGVYRVTDVLTPDGSDDPDHGPDDPAGWLSSWDEYVEHLADELGPGAWVGDVEAVPDLDVLRDGTGAEPAPLAAALGRIAADPVLRRALLTPVRSPDAPSREAVSYTAWFLRRLLGAPFAVGDTPLLPPAPPETAGLDAATLVALGGLRDLADLPGRDWSAILERLPARQGAEPVRLPAAVARAVWSGLAALARAADPRPVTAARLPALGPEGVTVESADDLAVAGSPRWAQLGPVVPAPADVAEDLADLLDLPYDGDPGVAPDGPGEPVELDPRVRALVPGAPATWRRHDRLTVEGTPVTWWVAEAGGAVVPHASSAAGLACALAEITGTDALLLEAALRDPDRAERLVAERAWP
ncbi:sacsin N-terminal ATP-binding-like domain-containing protein [Promicromonospora thailandica]|uniref:ATP-binding protein n=1 Tax=Promicromonospora thailandica TaxID=765201 RepID=A0A9X2JY39_9MICO|nr:ATP-binding protein [Promicromonospora thailandica]MCP2264694.1 hypothetical protein [Promicromonospora thailandica]BFF20221.1 hypothetical protein GCM10025730_37420 [Promicromonospora thailandica]